MVCLLASPKPPTSFSAALVFNEEFKELFIDLRFCAATHSWHLETCFQSWGSSFIPCSPYQLSCPENTSIYDPRIFETVKHVYIISNHFRWFHHNSSNSLLEFFLSQIKCTNMTRPQLTFGQPPSDLGVLLGSWRGFTGFAVLLALLFLFLAWEYLRDVVWPQKTHGISWLSLSRKYTYHW